MYYAAQDIIDYLMASTGGGVQDSEHRALRAAAHHAFRDVYSARDWLWYVTSGELEIGEGDAEKVFDLPANVSTIDALVPPDRTVVTQYVTAAEWKRRETWGLSSGGAVYWTIMKSPASPDRWQIRLAGPPPQFAEGSSYTFTYRRRPGPLRYFGYEDVCRTSGFGEDGMVRRYGTETNYPEGMFGIHPYVAQEIIGDAGSVIGTIPGGSVKTVVSDYLDIAEYMLTPVLTCAEMWLAKLNGKNVDGAYAVYRKDILQAFESDVVAPISGRVTGVVRYPEQNGAPYYLGG